MSRKFFSVDGCDDYTIVEITDLDAATIAALEQVAKRITDASTSQCKPRAEVVDETNWITQDYIRETEEVTPDE